MSEIKANANVDVEKVKPCVSQDAEIVELRAKCKALEEHLRLAQTSFGNMLRENIVHRNERILESSRIKFLEGKVLSLQYNPSEAQKRYEAETLAQLNDMARQLITSEIKFCEEQRQEWTVFGHELFKTQQDNEKKIKQECDDKLEQMRLDYEDQLKRAEIHRRRLEHELHFAQWQLEGKATANTLESSPNNAEVMDEGAISEPKRNNSKRNLTVHNSPEAPSVKRQCVDKVVAEQAVANAEEEEDCKVQEAENDSAVTVATFADAAQDSE